MRITEPNQVKVPSPLTGVRVLGGYFPRPIYLRSDGSMRRQPRSIYPFGGRHEIWLLTQLDRKPYASVPLAKAGCVRCLFSSFPIPIGIENWKTGLKSDDGWQMTGG